MGRVFLVTYRPCFSEKPTDVTDIDCSKSKTRSCKHIWILVISSQLENVLVCPADVATHR